jgi:hypothetical protein
MEQLATLEKQLSKKQSAYDQEVGALDMAKQTLQELYGKSFRMEAVEKDIQKKAARIKELEKAFEKTVTSLPTMMVENDDGR